MSPTGSDAPSCMRLSPFIAFIFLSPSGERLGEEVNPKVVSCITPSPSLSPKGERSMRGHHSAAAAFEDFKSVEYFRWTGALASKGLLRSRLLAISRIAGHASWPMSL